MLSPFIERHRKYKKNLANDVHVSCTFCKNNSFSLFQPLRIVFFLHKIRLFVCYTPVQGAKLGTIYEKWKKRHDHFFHFTKINTTAVDYC